MKNINSISSSKLTNSSIIKLADEEAATTSGGANLEVVSVVVNTTALNALRMIGDSSANHILGR